MTAADGHIATAIKQEDLTEAANGGPHVVGNPTYGRWAAQLHENGYEPLPIIPNSKRVAVASWTTVPIDAAKVERWARDYPNYGIGLRTGHLVGLDIDLLDPDLARQIMAMAMAMAVETFGDTPMRVGRWAKRLLIYRTDAPFPKQKIQGVEVLGLGQQLIAFGMHPDTRHPYYWSGSDSPLDVSLEQLPRVDAASVAAFLTRTAAVLKVATPPRCTGRRSSRDRCDTPHAEQPIRSVNGMVVDGRDAWLSQIAYHAVWDAEQVPVPIDEVTLALRVWERFADTTDLTRPKSRDGLTFDITDAEQKVAEKRRLLLDGRLPPRVVPESTPVNCTPGLPVDEARKALDASVAEACQRIETWHAAPDGFPPRIGIRASVGLGKTRVARSHLINLIARMKSQSKPHRLPALVPSHALAEEVAADSRDNDLKVAVLKGYDARDPISHLPMCNDIEMVRLAIAAQQRIQHTVCWQSRDAHCPFFAGYLKQKNRLDVSIADVVVPPYDVMFTGVAADTDTIGMVLIDEGFWQRAVNDTRGLFAETFGAESVLSVGTRRRKAQDEDWMADLARPRGIVQQALVANGSGAVTAERLAEAGLTTRDCLMARDLEMRRRQPFSLRPGLTAERRKHVASVIAGNAHVARLCAVWVALAEVLAGTATGRLHIMGPDSENGLHRLLVTRLQCVH